ncbi:hypothetical protein A8B78_21705 [Jannaschia sp. EhC01]|nr:hypothetical protein A8B78_21705 [Jannaschia sp. EhC01]
MAVKTGYKKREVADLRARIKAHRAALRTHLPDAPLGDLRLVCGCSNCIDDDAYQALTTIPVPALTPRQVSFYFGGAGVMAPDTGAEARVEAFGIFLHVLDALAEAVLAEREVEGSYRRAWDFVEPEYWHLPLYRSGFLEDLTGPQRTQIADFLVDCVELGIAKNLPRMDDALVFLSLVTDRFGAVLEGIAKGPPRRQLAFWIAVAGWAPNSPAGKKNNGVKNFCNSFAFMEESARHALEDALADPEVEILLDRYAFAAKDREWLGFLSRLVAWRENTVALNAANRVNPPGWIRAPL